jgi:vacuolar iron transporter family protein
MGILHLRKRKFEKLSGYLDEAVYGANDGIITTFAVISGATGAALGSNAIIIMGLANLIADGFSMGASSYLSIRTEEDVAKLKMFGNTNKDPLRRSSATFGAFLVAGTLPLLPFMGMDVEGNEFLASAIAAGLAFFFVGGSRTIVTKKGFFVSGLEMFLVGSIAAILAYSIGYVISGIVG